MTRSAACILGITASATLSAGAASLASYQFSTTYNNSLTLPAGISSAGPVTAGPGLSGDTIPGTAGMGISTNSGGTLYVRSSILYRAEPAEKNITSAIAAGDYFSFDLTITSGYTLDLNSVSASIWSSTANAADTYTTNVAVYYTLNGTSLTSELVAVKLGEYSSANSTSTARSFTDNLGGNEALSGSVRFHFVFWDAANHNLDNRVTRLDNIIVDGTLTSVPEPSALSLSALLLAFPLLRRRRA